MSLVQETKMFNLSTRSSCGTILNADPNFKSQVEYNIPNMIVRDESIEYIQFSIPEAVIPVSFFTINESNCLLNLIENGVTKVFSFTYGNYNANYFITEFKKVLGSNWNITLNAYNNIFTITNSVNAFTLLGSSSIDYILGFSDTLVSSVVNGINTIVLPRCCNFLPLPRVVIRCAELANTCMVGGSSSSSDVLMTIANNSKPNGQIYYLNQSQSRLLFRHHELSRFVVSFTDDDGNLLNFNGVSSFFTFQFDIYRKFTPKLPRFSNIVEYVNNKTFIYPDEEDTIEMNV
jgi:hypothetical protein